MRSLIFILLMMAIASVTIFDFSTDSSLQNWRMVNDEVMGGASSGSISLNEEGHGVFQGEISLANNGGFSSVRHDFDYISVEEFSEIKIRLKGDGKPYQFRVRHDRSARYSYTYAFNTSGDWEEIVIPLKEMKPVFRGRQLDLPNFGHDQIGELSFLFGNKKEESFKLVIDRIDLQ